MGQINKEDPMSDLDTVAAEFKKLKGNLSYCRYPEHLWDKAFQLTTHHPLQAIASALGMSVHYLKRKCAHRGKSITFASVQVAPAPESIEIQFKHMTLHVHESQAIAIIQTLMRGI
jgi:hypothetical protein